MKSLNLLSIDSNAKTIKGQKKGFKTAILYLAPHKLAVKVYRENPRKFRADLKKRYGVEISDSIIYQALRESNMCEHAQTCLKDCLNTAGRGAFNSIQYARALKTAFYISSYSRFRAALKHELSLFKKREQKYKLAFRFNGTSDMDEIGLVLWAKEQGFNVYDYTKDYDRFLDMEYNLTYSIQCEEDFEKWKASPVGNCAIVYKDEGALKQFEGFNLIDGDEHDLRFLDDEGIVVLKAKGKARKSKSQFIVDNWK